jgi:hypothetical protein
MENWLESQGVMALANIAFLVFHSDDAFHVPGKSGFWNASARTMEPGA